MRALTLATFLLAAALASIPVASADPGPVSPFAGIWSEAPTAGDAQRLDELGAGLVRVGVYWRLIQPTPAAFDWSQLDQTLVNASAGGKRRVLATVRDAPSWAASIRCRVITDAERGRLADFARKLVLRYGSTIPDGPFAGNAVNVLDWEFYNEPDNTSANLDATSDLGGCFGTLDNGVPSDAGRIGYAAMLEVVGAAVHSASLSARVLTGGVVSGNTTDAATTDCPIETACVFDRGFLRGVMAALAAHGTLDRLDEVAVHYFSSQWITWQDGGSDLIGRISHVRQDMLSAGLTIDQFKPIIVDEAGYTTIIGTSKDPTYAFALRQRDYVIKALSRAASANIDGYVWFGLRDFPSGLGSDNAYGLVDSSDTAKPAYAAFRTFTRFVSSKQQFVGVLTLQNGLEGYEFQLPSGLHLQTIWNEQSPDARIAYAPSGLIGAVLDPVGDSADWDWTGTVLIGPEPRLIVLAPPASSASNDAGGLTIDQGEGSGSD